jgi:pimeloyl-ACP methyl ester carboxylesterase
MKKVFVAGHPMAYHRTGRGEPVLLVHGVLSHSFIWREVIPKLAERYEVVAVDLLGCGDSTMPMRLSLSLKAQADYLAELVQWLGLGKVHFVGHEVGGAIGQTMAVRHPKALRSLSLVNSVATNLWPVWPVSWLKIPFLRHLVLSTLDVGLFDWIVRRSIAHRDRITDDLMMEFYRPLQTLTGRRALLHFAECLESSELTALEPDLRQLTIPVNVIWGAADRLLPAATLGALRATFPASRLHRIESAGHLVPVDEPEKLAAALLDALRPAPPQG